MNAGTGEGQTVRKGRPRAPMAALSLREKAFIDAYPHRGPEKSEPLAAEPCPSLRDRRGRPASETGFSPCIESRYRWTLRLRRRLITITSANTLVTQNTTCMIIPF